MNRKLVSLFLALCLVLTMCSTVFAEGGKKYTETDTGDGWILVVNVAARPWAILPCPARP